MRFMVIVKADHRSEAGDLPDEKLLAEMGKFNDELVKAGVLLAAEGLQPSSKGERVTKSGDKVTVTDGPFTETKDLIAGFAIVEAKSKEEAIRLAQNFLDVVGGGVSEVRPMAGAPDLATV